MEEFHVFVDDLSRLKQVCLVVMCLIFSYTRIFYLGMWVELEGAGIAYYITIIP